jgi:hypothetical protein
LSQAIAMVSDLSQSNSLSGSTSDTLNSDELERIFWLLYSIEKPHALRFGSHSVSGRPIYDEVKAASWAATLRAAGLLCPGNQLPYTTSLLERRSLALLIL